MSRETHSREAPSVNLRRTVATLAVTFALGVPGAASPAAAGEAAEAQVPTPPPPPGSPYARGPEPTLAALDAEVGPFAVGAMSIPSQWPRYAGGTVYAAFDTSQGRFGVIAVAPGHNADASDI